MDIYLKRVIKRFASRYTIFSNVENATVFFDGEQVGTIQQGKCLVEIDYDIAKDSYVVTLEGGNLPSDILTYNFSVNPSELNFVSGGETKAVNVISTLITESFHNTSGTVFREQSLTLNYTSIETPSNPTFTSQVGNGINGGFSINGINITANNNENIHATTIQRTGKALFIQAGSGKTAEVNLIQAGREVVTYTVNYPWNGANVYFDSVKVGTISNGKLIVYKFADEAADTYNVTFDGGTLPALTHDYTFTVVNSTMNFTSAGGSQTPSITSIDRVGTPVHSTGTIVGKNNSVDVSHSYTYTEQGVAWTVSASGTGFSGSGTTITASSNESSTSTTAQRTGTATVTQSISGKTATINLVQAGRTMYSFTVNSNCNGGTVYADNVSKGTISGSRLVFYDPSNATKTIRISGGVPSTSTNRVANGNDYDSSTDYDYTTDYDCSVSDTSFSFDYNGGNGSAQVYNSKRDGTRTRSMSRSRTKYDVTTTTYSAPANKTCAANSSTTMNYTSSNSYSTEYGSWSSWSYGSWGSWSYGSWEFITPTVSAQSSWAPAAISGSSEPWTLHVHCGPNSSTSSRSDYFNVNLLDGTYRVNLSQSGKPADVYVFEFTSGGGGTSYTDNEEYRPNGKNIYNNNYSSWIGVVSTKNGSNIGGTGSISRGSAGVSDLNGALSGDIKCWIKSLTNTGNTALGPYSATFTQTGSGKKITWSGIYIAAVNFTANKSSLSFAAGGGSNTVTLNYGYTKKTSMPINASYSANVTSKPSWCTCSISGSTLNVKASANTSTSSRSGTIVLTETELGSKTVSISVSQTGATAFGVAFGGTTYTSAFNLTSPWLNGLASSPGVTPNKAWTATITTKPSTSVIASISVTSSGSAGTACYIAPTSNTMFSQSQFVVRITATDGSGSIDITCKMGARKNAFFIKPSFNGTAVVFKTSVNLSESEFRKMRVTSLSANTTFTVTDVYTNKTSTTTTTPFNTSDSITTSRTFYFWFKDGSGILQQTSINTSYVASTNNPPVL